MIFVHRSPEPGDLVNERESELPKIRAYYDPANLRKLQEEAAARQKPAKPAKPARAGKPRKAQAKRPRDPKSYDFKAYLVAKRHLEDLFHKKCAYCEFKYKAGLTGDIEHYRPKGRVLPLKGKPIWPGYYWLAASWTNLVPVCSMCNKKSTVLDLTDGRERVTGKGERFPLADESKRVKPEEDPANEDPLLLDPCTQKPEDHLTFVEREGHRALLSGQTEKGRQTIEILGLNRTDLVERRLERLLLIEGLMADIQRAQRQATRAANDDDRNVALAEIADKKVRLEAFQNPESEFAALARHAVPAFINAMKHIADSSL